MYGKPDCFQTHQPKPDILLRTGGIEELVSTHNSCFYIMILYYTSGMDLKGLSPPAGVWKSSSHAVSLERSFIYLSFRNHIYAIDC